MKWVESYLWSQCHKPLSMKQRFYLYCRGNTFYLQDSRTGKQQSLETKDRNTALHRLELKHQTAAPL